jgi:spore coat-associated protein S
VNALEQKQIEHRIAYEVMKMYPYNVKDITLLSSKSGQTIWQVETDDGGKILRELSIRPERMLFYTEAHLHLQKQGFPIAPLCLTKNGAFCIGGDGVAYELHDHVSGKDVSYYDAEQLEKVMKLLGHFHKASQGFTPSKQSKKRNRLGTWYKRYIWKMQELQGYKKVASRFLDDPFSQLFLEQVDKMLKMARQSILKLETSTYEEWTKGEQKWRGFVHKNIALSSFTEINGKIVMKTTPAIALDLPTKDLQVLLSKIMKKMAVWDDEFAFRLLRVYDSIHPLTEQQYRILQADLLFPHLFSSVARKYFLKQKEIWSDEKYMRELQTAVSVENTKIEMLKNFPEMVRKIKDNGGVDSEEN